MMMQRSRSHYSAAIAGLSFLALASVGAHAQAKPAAPPTQPAAAPQAAPKPRLTPITALTFSADGKKLAVGTYGEVLLYDTATWAEAGNFRQVVDSARSLSFQPNGSLLAIGCGLPGRSGNTLLWNTAGNEKPYSYPPMGDTVEALTFDKDGKEILLGANDNKAHFYTSLSSNTGTNIDAHNGRVSAVAFSPKPGTLYVTGGMDKIVKVWVEKSGQNVCNFDQCDSGLTGLVFLSNGVQFVGSGLDGKLYWWGVSHDERKDTYGGYFFRQFEAHPGGVYTLSGAANGQRIITGGADKLVNVWNPDNGQKIKSFNDSQSPIYAAALSPDGKIAAAGGRDGVVLIWDVDAGKLLTTITPAQAPVAAPKAAVPTKAPAKPTIKHR